MTEIFYLDFFLRAEDLREMLELKHCNLSPYLNKNLSNTTIL